MAILLIRDYVVQPFYFKQTHFKRIMKSSAFLTEEHDNPLACSQMTLWFDMNDTVLLCCCEHYFPYFHIKNCF